MKLNLKTVLSGMLTFCLLFAPVSASAKNTKCDTYQEIEDFQEDTTNFVVATLIDNRWTANIIASDINADWSGEDTLSVDNFDFAEDSVINDDGSLKLIFSNTDDYSIGSVATMTFFNESKDEYGDLFINFSDTDIPTFQSEDLKNYVINDNLKITSFVLPDESDVDFVTDNKQELNKEELAPEEIILAEDNPNKLGAIKK